MKLRAQIVIDVDADDFVEAAKHQVKIESFLRELEPEYPSVVLTFRERRAAAMGASDPQATGVRKPTGKLNIYEEPGDEA
jgi:hypothetical protein